MAMTSSSGRGVKNYVLQNFPLLQKDIYIYIFFYGLLLLRTEFSGRAV